MTKNNCVEITLYFDGASRGNPGPGGAGALLSKGIPPNHEIIGKYSKNLGTTTNNAAEYNAIILGLRKVKMLLGDQLECDRLLIKGDSQLAIRQLKGEYKVKSSNLEPLYTEVKKLLSDLRSSGIEVKLEHIPRKLNSIADKLANRAIDEQ